MENYTSWILGFVVDENTTRYFDWEKLLLEKNWEFKNNKWDILTIWETAWYISWNYIFSWNLLYLVLLTWDNWLSWKIEYMDSQVNYYSRGLYNEHFELLSWEVLERINEIWIWTYSKWILKNWKFEVTETHVCKDDNNCLNDWFEPICFLWSTPSTGHNEDNIEQKCYDIKSLLNIDTVHWLFVWIGETN